MCFVLFCFKPDYNPILLYLPGIVYFCLPPKRKGRLQALMGWFGSSPETDGVRSQKLKLLSTEISHEAQAQ